MTAKRIEQLETKVAENCQQIENILTDAARAIQILGDHEQRIRAIENNQTATPTKTTMKQKMVSIEFIHDVDEKAGGPYSAGQIVSVNEGSARHWLTRNKAKKSDASDASNDETPVARPKATKRT